MIKKESANSFIRTILAHVGGYKLASILTPSFMIGEVIMEMVIPLLMASIIDHGVNTGDMDHIIRVGGWMLLAAAAGLLFGWDKALSSARGHPPDWRRTSGGRSLSISRDSPLQTSTTSG